MKISWAKVFNMWINKVPLEAFYKGQWVPIIGYPIFHNDETIRIRKTNAI